MQARQQQAVRLGSVVRLGICAIDGTSQRTATWRLATVTDRAAGELGVSDTALGAQLMDTCVDDELHVQPPGGEGFYATVLQVTG